MSETAGPTKYRVLSHPDEGPLWADRGVHAGSSPVKAIENAVAARTESDGPEAEMNTEWANRAALDDLDVRGDRLLDAIGHVERMLKPSRIAQVTKEAVAARLGAELEDLRARVRGGS